MELTLNEFRSFQGLIHQLCGIVITDGKEYLIRQRLEPIVRSEGLPSFSALYDRLKHATPQVLKDNVIAALTTNETSFFRDKHPFDTFKEHLLPELSRLARERKNGASARKGSKVAIWCAAASTGQEPYTLAMLVHEHAKANAHTGIVADDFNIFSTDISTRVLSKAVEGAYTDLEVNRGLPQLYRDRYFDKAGDKWVARENIRSMIDFKQLNLMHSLNHLPGFDLIYCRNVLIYFDDDAKRRVLQEFHRLLASGGALVLGASENIYGLTNLFESTRHRETIVYRKC